MKVYDEDEIFEQANRYVRRPDRVWHTIRNLAIILGVLGLLIWLTGCAGTRAGDAVSEYRENHEAVVAFELRGGLAWIGFGIRKVGKQAEIEVIEGEKPFSAKSSL